MRIDFAKLSPGGNETLIVTSEVAPCDRAKVALKLMEQEYVPAEQVGFLSKDDKRLDMMGGEFCGNALRSAAAINSIKTNSSNVQLESSGTENIFDLLCQKQSNTNVDVTLTIPITSKVRTLKNKNMLVELEGIAFILVKRDKPCSEREALKLFDKFIPDIIDQPAFGVVPYWQEDDCYAIAPVITVSETGTIIPESACGSGSIALTLGLDWNSLTVKQPSGCLYTICRNGDQISLSSPVRLLVTGTAHI
jgi:diaminopimelate epimerase